MTSPAGDAENVPPLVPVKVADSNVDVAQNGEAYKMVADGGRFTESLLMARPS